MQQTPVVESQDRTDSGADRPRYATLADYLRVLRRHWKLVLLFLIVCTGVGYGISKAQSPKYESTANIGYTEIQQLIGGGVFSGGLSSVSLPPGIRSAQIAKQITTPQIAKEVKKKLKTKLSAKDLEDAVSTQVGLTTNLVEITASASTAKLAAKVANEFAAVTVHDLNKESRRQLNKTASQLEDQLKQAPKSAIPSFPGPERQALKAQLQRVQLAQASPDPARVAEEGTPPPDPASPAIVRNTVIGAVLGLVFGLLSAFARDTLDRRLHSAHEVHVETGMPILGRVADKVMGRPGLALNGGPPMLDTEFEGFRALRTNLGVLGTDPPARMILVTSGLPEEGKTTVSASLASAAAIAGQGVLLMECDLRRPTLARRMGIARSPGLSDYLNGTATPQQILQPVSLANPRLTGQAAAVGGNGGSMICVTAGSPVGNPAELLQSERFGQVLDKVRKAYDLVILDSGPVLAVVDPLQLVSHVDAILVCVRARRTTRDQARALRAALANMPPRPAGAVITGISKGDPDSYDYYYGD
jgi:tyrosine-protein kinase